MFLPLSYVVKTADILDNCINCCTPSKSLLQLRATAIYQLLLEEQLQLYTTLQCFSPASRYMQAKIVATEYWNHLTLLNNAYLLL